MPKYRAEIILVLHIEQPTLKDAKDMAAGQAISANTYNGEVDPQLLHGVRLGKVEEM